MNTQEQLQVVKYQLAALDPNNRNDMAAIQRLKTQEAELTKQLASETEQEQALLVRIQEQEVKRDGYTLPADLVALFSSPYHLDADGNPYEATGANHIVLQIVKDALRTNDEEWNEKYSDLEAKYDSDIRIIAAQRDEFDRQTKEKDGLIEELRKQLSQAIIDKEDAEAKRDAAVRERKEIEVKESQDLATMIAEQQAEKERKAAEDRAKRTVYDVVPDAAINPRNFTAKLAATGETITYNWTQQKSYIVLTDPDEILQFRNQHANANVDQQDHAVSTESVQDSVSQFPEVPRAEAPDLSTEPVQVDQGQPSGEVSAAEAGAVTRAEFEALKLRVVELEKVCNINEDTDNQAVA